MAFGVVHVVLCFLFGGGVVGNFWLCDFVPKMAALQGGVVGGVAFRSGQDMTGGESARPGEGGGSEEDTELLELSDDAAESPLG